MLSALLPNPKPKTQRSAISLSFFLSVGAVGARLLLGTGPTSRQVPFLRHGKVHMAHVIAVKRLSRSKGGGTEHADWVHIVLTSLLSVVSISVRPVLCARQNFPLCVHARMIRTRELAAGPELAKAHQTEAPPTHCYITCSMSLLTRLP